MVLELEKQDKDWNCGVYAVRFLMVLNGEGMFKSDLERLLCTTKENGTSPELISKLFKTTSSSGYDSNIDKIKCPAIVNYQYCDEDGCDGHYGVIIHISNLSIVIYNPAIGKLEHLHKKLFVKNWYSNRYGKRWHLSI